MMNRILQLVAYRAADYLNREVRSLLWPVIPYLRQLSLGLLLIVSSAVVWLISFIFLFLALFFYLSQANGLIEPAFWTGFVSLGLGFIMVFFGLNMIRRPR